MPARGRYMLCARRRRRQPTTLNSAVRPGGISAVAPRRAGMHHAWRMLCIALCMCCMHDAAQPTSICFGRAWRVSYIMQFNLYNQDYPFIIHRQ